VTDAILLVGSRPVIQVVRVGEDLVFEGDIALAPGQVAPLDSGIPAREDEGDGVEVGSRAQPLLSSQPASLWPGGVVPYTIASGLSSTMRARAEEAIRRINGQTAARLVPRTGERDYVTIRPHAEYWAYANIGRIGGQQFVTLGVNNSVGVIVHELGHSLGFWHEPTCPDRVQHVTIYWGNIIPGMYCNFATYASGLTVGPYDI